MATTSAITGATTTALTSSQQGMAAKSQDFLKLLVAQMTHQDPLSPMDNQQMVVQLAQIQSLEELISMGKSSSQISQYQELTAANSLIGSPVIGADENGAEIAGYVEKVKISEGEVSLIVNGTPINIKSIKEVY